MSGGLVKTSIPGWLMNPVRVVQTGLELLDGTKLTREQARYRLEYDKRKSRKAKYRVKAIGAPNNAKESTTPRGPY